jgi:plasmid stability protein
LEAGKMAQVLVRGLDEKLVNRIRANARKRGWSMQKELRRMLALAVDAPDPENDRTVYPPVKAVRVKGKPASASLVEDRR